MTATQADPVWNRIRTETEKHAQEEPLLASFLHSTILNHNTLECALSFHLANQLDSPTVSSLMLREVILQAMQRDASIRDAMRADLVAVVDRDSASQELYVPFLYFKGFHALQSQRIAHWLWNNGRESMALFFQNRVSVKFGVDIHPAAKLGRGIMLDHATGLVIGETAVVGDDVSILQSVTLGGTGKDEGDRHPKIGNGVLISAGAKILGNIRVGEGAKVGAGSVVLEEVPPHTTVAGVPAKIVGRPATDAPALDMNHDFCCDENADC
ncbi:serine O-acetyltransferase [Halioglobus japonicus]|uniref:Serine acetyltransferase n=1 Tax=Halioglobus japonicus TaxID=930805 RepID=A0AAP8MDB4_9GAMM|nr:serine O-acetyltransferase [Halioglobus japonicus]AQA17517.1 serine O-acetyltransferase [Halioglobus japonicus]PLW85447.1 serine O-acetyltransferase [Halioglobus japonicus]GHD15695.1 serine O-acetyltransferase [Halioglobus japonicus]